MSKETPAEGGGKRISDRRVDIDGCIYSPCAYLSVRNALKSMHSFTVLALLLLLLCCCCCFVCFILATNLSTPELTFALIWAAMRAILMFHSLRGTKSQDSVLRLQILRRKESRSGIEPRSFCLPT